MHELNCFSKKNILQKSSKRNAISLICLCFNMYDEFLKTFVLEKILRVLVLYERSPIQNSSNQEREGGGSEEESGGEGEEKR